jgi:hypothetical protein
MGRRVREAQDANRDRGKKTKDKVLSLIIQSEPAGMSTRDLLEATGLHRDRIHVVCKEYMDKGVLDKTGRFGKYHLGPKAREDIHIKAFFYQQKVFEWFSRLAGKSILASSKYFNDYGRLLHLSKEREEYNKNFSKKSRELDELYMYEYALKLGAILTFQLIQSIKYAQQDPDLDISKKDRTIIKWVENVINPLSLLESFSHTYPVYKRMYVPKENTGDFEPSFFGLQSVKIQELEKTFENIFPTLFKDLEEIKHSDDLMGKVEWAKNHALELSRLTKSEKKIERLEKDDPNHIKCGGKLEPMPFIHNKGQYVRRCSKCRRWIPVRV